MSARSGQGDSITTVLDEAESLVGALATGPWLAFLWCTAVPLRFLQAHFFERALSLGSDAERFATYLGELSVFIGVTFLVAAAGRAIFARACGLAHASGDLPGREALSLAPGPFANYLYVLLVLELLSLLSAVLVITLPILVMLGGLATATWERSGPPHPFRPLARLATHTRRLRVLFGINIVWFFATAVAGLNVWMLFLVLPMLANAFGADPGPWMQRLGMTNPALPWLALGGAWLIVEPFFIASHVVFARGLESRRRGDDLKRRLGRLAPTEEAAST
ncbi:MAG: hypothetical protein AAGD38_11490 [Acidobacteriota bacterium]